MDWSGHPYLLCEEVTDAVRQVLPAAHHKRLSLLFDYQGAFAIARDEGRVVRSVLERLLSAAIAATGEGSVFCLVDVEPVELDRCRLDVKVIDTSPGLSEAALEVLHGDVSLASAASSNPTVASLVAVRALCEAIGGRFDYRQSPGNGAISRVRVPVPCFAPVFETPDTHIDGAQAWLIEGAIPDDELLAYRLQRQGWSLRLLAGPVEAQEALQRRPASTRPALVVGREHRNVSLEGVAALRQWLAPPSQLFYLVNAASSTARSARTDGVCVQVAPFSPRQLVHVAQLASQAGLRPSGDTQPAPLVLGNRPQALVVHDDATQGEIVGAMLMALGHDAMFAPTVDDALAAAAGERAPAVVILLLDLAHDEACEAVDRLSVAAAGTMRIIVAATRERLDEGLGDSPIGADALIAKPLTIQKLAETLPARWPWA